MERDTCLGILTYLSDAMRTQGSSFVNAGFGGSVVIYLSPEADEDTYGGSQTVCGATGNL